MLLLPRLCWILSVIVDWGGLGFAVLRHNVFQGSGEMETSKLRDGIRIVLVLSIHISFFFSIFKIEIIYINKNDRLWHYFWCVIKLSKNMIQLLKEEAKNKNKNGMISKICKRCSILMCCNTRNFSYTDLTLATRNQVFQAWNREWITRGKLFWQAACFKQCGRFLGTRPGDKRLQRRKS